jgi:hypothetical protein
MLGRILAGALTVIGALTLSSAPARAAPEQVAIVSDFRVISDPVGTLNRFRLLGAQELRLTIPWQGLAPRADSRHRPHHFSAGDPASYPDAAWAPYDGAIQQAEADGMTVLLNPIGGAPLWATGRGAPTGQPHPSWEPNAGDFGAFVRAVGERYSGNYDPKTHRLDPGNPDDLPAITDWSIWNEPNFGPSLAPQGLPGRLEIEHSSASYRALVDAAWSALLASGHQGQTILIGELAPHGAPNRRQGRTLPFGVFSMMKPIQFLRNLYCVDSGYRPLQGADAAVRGCPTTATGQRAFRAAHPALFAATGLAIHPYSAWYPPTEDLDPDPDYGSMHNLPRVERALDRLQGVYGSHRRLSVWNTEYGYLTRPPKHSTKRAPVITPATAAAYINQAEYMSWRDPRIRSFDQYLLEDPLAPTKANGFGGYASGLLSWNGRPKADYHAWRLPLYLPRTDGSPGDALEVWGCVRPAFFALADVPADVQQAQIQFAPGQSGQFTTVAQVPIDDVHGYFDQRISFPGSGQVRLAWTYPADDPSLAPGYTVYSRTVAIHLS